MWVPSDVELGGLQGEDAKNPVILWVARILAPIIRAINGSLTFGTGYAIDNISGRWITWTTSGSEDLLMHNLGVVPVGFLVAVPPQDGVINSGTTSWNTSTISVKCSVAGQIVRIFVLSPPLTS